MRPLRLELRGFTAFRRTAVVDFSGRTLFAITGPTGAGKSSLLDAMTWALYGQVPRVGRSTHQLVTHGEKAMSVRFDFSARGHTYRVTRTTAGAIGTRLERQMEGEGDRWALVADRAGEVTKEIGKLVGLDYATFTKTIVLPQGEFGAFLRGEERERRDILSTLLGLEAYEAVGRAARGRARESLQSVDLLKRQIDRLTLGTPEAIAGLEAERSALGARQVTSAAMREGLATLKTAGETHAANVRALDEARRAARAAAEACAEAERAMVAAAEEARTASERQVTLQAEGAELGYDAAAHQRLREAAQLIAAREAASKALADARSAEATARAHLEAASLALAQASRDEATRGAAAQGACDALRESTAALSEAISRARAVLLGLRAAEVETELAATKAESASRSQARLAQQLEALAAEAASLEADEAAARRMAEAATAASNAARDSEGIAAQAAETASARLGRAREHLDESRAHQAAGVLRAGLHAGDACPVCGSQVTQLPLHPTSDLEAAQAAVAEAEAILRDALEAQRLAAANAATSAARLEALASDAERRAQRGRALASAVGELNCGCESPNSQALARVAASAAASAAKSEAATREAREELEHLRKAHHALDVRIAEASTRLPDTGLEAAPEPLAGANFDAAKAAAEVLAGAVAAHTAASASANGALEAQRTATEAVARAGELVAGARREVDQREASTAAATRQLETLPAPSRTDLAEGDLESALAAAEALARKALDIETRAQEAATRAAVLKERAQERATQSAQRATAAEAATALLEVRALAASETEADFSARWRDLLGDVSAPDFGSLPTLAAEVETEARAIAQALGSVEARLERARVEAAEAAQLSADVQAHEAVGRVAGALERELHADRFIAYVQREALAVLAADASARLLHLTGGRYRLVGEADEFYVIDHLNGEERRSVRTLSGGETFLASLALALALSERLPELAGAGGALSLESLFLDEGFGSLDAASLDVAIEGLERLAGGRRLIGVISHVPEIAERLPDRIDILKAPEGSAIAARAER